MATCGECAGRRYCISCQGSGRDREDFGIGQCRHCRGHGYCPRCKGAGHDGTDFGVPGKVLYSKNGSTYEFKDYGTNGGPWVGGDYEVSYLYAERGSEPEPEHGMLRCDDSADGPVRYDL